MKKLISSCCCVMLLLAFCVSCADDPEAGGKPVSLVDDSKLAEARLALGVADMRTGLQTRAEAEMTEDEKRGTPGERMVNDIWVFQFAEDGRLLITPRYYDIEDMDPQDGGGQVDVLLRKDVANSTVCVVANTGRDDWATVENAATLADLQELTLPDPRIIVGEDALGLKDEGAGTQDTDDPDNLNIPMEGRAERVAFADGAVEVPLTRMYAKVVITVGTVPETIKLTDVTAMDIPYYCRVKTLEDPANFDSAAVYPQDEYSWNSRSFSPGDKNADDQYEGRIVIYTPENLQGRSDNSKDNPELKDKAGRPHAFGVRLYANYVDIFTGENIETGREYSWYPGQNNYNDYNIRRNYIYDVRLNIYTDAYNQAIPSSNCFVVKPGQMLSFQPYYRVETGGGYKFTDYLDASGPDEKKIDRVEILWQTKDAIGDNTNGDLVWIAPAPDAGLDADEKGRQEYQRKIYVCAGQRGNAVIAARNKQGDIVWSWHIWVTENDPGNVSSAILYTTYAWNEEGIKTGIRVPGYDIMPCNLGALRYEPDGNADASDTYGMLYQWGRKDPFPPAYSGNDGADYTDERAGVHYGNDNKTPVGKTTGEDNAKLFHSLPGAQITEDKLPDPVGFTVKNPTVFMCGTKEAKTGTAVNSSTYYQNGGDWTWNHDDKLWGGLKPGAEGMKCYTIPGVSGVHIYDNYGDQKTIFDPCPSGWRVPPGELWLGFTKTGLNPATMSDINTSGAKSSGMYMYMAA